MKILIRYIFILVFIPCIKTSGQNILMEYGHVTMEELKINSYAQDTSAAAIILFDKGESVEKSRGYYKFTRHVRIKIFNTEGLNWANFSILVPRDGVILDEIQGSSYNLKGTTIIETKLTLLCHN